MVEVANRVGNKRGHSNEYRKLPSRTGDVPHRRLKAKLSVDSARTRFADISAISSKLDVPTATPVVANSKALPPPTGSN